MEYRAVAKMAGDGWIDLPRVNARERSREKLMESLRMGAEDLPAGGAPFEPGAQMITIEVPDPDWAADDL